MTDRDIIEHLAKKVMGWNLRALALTSGIFDAPDNHVAVWPRNWNPLESRDDAAEVETKVLAGPKDNEYVYRIYDQIAKGLTVIGTQRLYRSLLTVTPRQRCTAIYEATKGTL